MRYDRTPNQIIEGLIALRDTADFSRSERDLLADACNMISSLQWKLTHDAECEDCAGTGLDRAILDDPCDTCAGEGTNPDAEGF